MFPVAPKLAIVGSCITRDGFEFEGPRRTAISSYLARQSFAGLSGPALAYDEAWYGDLNPFERRCALADLGKGGDYWAFENAAEWLVVDYIDERFDLLKIGRTLVSGTKQVKQPGFLARYADAFTLQPRLSAETTAMWRTGAEVFFRRALKRFRPERIILHEGNWASAFRARDGTTSSFPPGYARLIGPHNALLESYFAITKELVPGISVIRVSPDLVFADPEHRWSKEPFHYISDYYHAFLGALHALTSAEPGRARVEPVENGG